MQIAEEVVGEEIRSRPESVISRVNRAVCQLLDDTPLTLFLHPEDHSKFVGHLDIPVMADARIRPGDARLEGESLGVVLEIERHLAALRSTLLPGAPGEA